MLEHVPGCMRKKIGGRRGIARLHGILIVCIAVLVIVLAIPVWKSYRRRAEAMGCMAALDTAWRQIRDEVIFSGGGLMVDEANGVLAYAMPERYRDSLCPAGGTVYFILDEDGGYTPVCGLHDSDTAERTRLNAAYALSLLRNGLSAGGRASKEEGLPIELNGQELLCALSEEKPAIRRGTALTRGYDGTVAFYGLDAGGEPEWFLYADENHYACWDGQMWTGDSYGDMY